MYIRIVTYKYAWRLKSEESNKEIIGNNKSKFFYSILEVKTGDFIEHVYKRQKNFYCLFFQYFSYVNKKSYLGEEAEAILLCLPTHGRQRGRSHLGRGQYSDILGVSLFPWGSWDSAILCYVIKLVVLGLGFFLPVAVLRVSKPLFLNLYLLIFVPYKWKGIGWN